MHRDVEDSPDRAITEATPVVVEPLEVLPAAEAKLVVVPAHNRVVSLPWVRNLCIIVAGCTCLAANVLTWITTRDVNAILIGAGLSLLLGIPFLNVGDHK